MTVTIATSCVGLCLTNVKAYSGWLDSFSGTVRHGLTSQDQFYNDDGTFYVQVTNDSSSSAEKLKVAIRRADQKWWGTYWTNPYNSQYVYAGTSKDLTYTATKDHYYKLYFESCNSSDWNTYFSGTVYDSN